jgi:ABC-2 type transport system permease protein
VSLEVSSDRPMAAPLPKAGRLKSVFDFYATSMRTSVIRGFQYRVANYFYMIGMLAEPVIYIVVWSTVARSQGGVVGGFTVGQLAAYYIVWTLVRQMNIALTPAAWEWRIREGQLAGMLLRPLHPIHYDLADLAGWKVVNILLWLPIAAVLTLVFRPTLHPRALDIVVFAVAIWGGYLVRSMALWILGLITFWTTRVNAIFEMYFATELILSGRLVPMQLMPKWVQHVANFLPFKWTFGYPIEALIGRLSTSQLLEGLGAQALWTGIGLGIIALMWPRAINRFTSVGN